VPFCSKSRSADGNYFGPHLADHRIRNQNRDVNFIKDLRTRIVVCVSFGWELPGAAGALYRVDPLCVEQNWGDEVRFGSKAEAANQDNDVSFNSVIRSRSDTARPFHMRLNAFGAIPQGAA
jgi:hypothetical protein